MATLSDVEKVFLKEIFENPGDDATRLIYADWLQEYGNAAKGQFITNQIINKQEVIRIGKQINIFWSRGFINRVEVKDLDYLIDHPKIFKQPGLIFTVDKDPWPWDFLFKHNYSTLELPHWKLRKDKFKWASAKHEGIRKEIFSLIDAKEEKWWFDESIKRFTTKKEANNALYRACYQYIEAQP